MKVPTNKLSFNISSNFNLPEIENRAEWLKSLTFTVKVGFIKSL
jgi:hypothetical protein